MRRITIGLPDDLAAALRAEANHRGTSVSAVAREAIAIHLGHPSGKRTLPFFALGASGYRTTARDMEVLMARWADDIYADAMGRGLVSPSA